MGNDITQLRKKIPVIRRLIRWELTPLRIIIIYVIVGGLWMLLSDELLIAVVSDPVTRGRLEILTDWLYVVATAWMLHALIRRNIAATQEATEALQDSEEQFRQLAGHVQEAFWIYSPDQGLFTYVSPAYETIWGYPSERLYTQPESWLTVIHPEDREHVAILENRRHCEYDETYRIVHPGGAIRWIRDRSFPIKSEGGQVQRICGVTRDVTERVLDQ